MPHPSDRTALVMGLGRSGTTFLAKLIDSSPDVLYRHEPDALLPTDMPVFLHRDDLKPHVPKARAYIGAMTRCRKLRANGHLPVFAKRYRGAMANLVFRPMVLTTKLAETCRMPVVDSLPDLMGRDRGDVVYLIKSVSALGRARLLSEAAPSMASVHIVRHPCAVIASLRAGIGKGVMASNVYLKPLFAQQEAARYPFRLEDLEALTFEEQAAFRWMFINDKAAADMEGMPSYLRISYEDLCTRLEDVTQQVFDHLNLPLGDQTRDFIGRISRPATDDRNNIGYFKIDRPVTSALDKWKTTLDPACIERIRQMVSHSPLGRAYFQDDTLAPDLKAAS